MTIGMLHPGEMGSAVGAAARALVLFGRPRAEVRRAAIGPLPRESRMSWR